MVLGPSKGLNKIAALLLKSSLIAAATGEGQMLGLGNHLVYGVTSPRV